MTRQLEIADHPLYTLNPDLTRIDISAAPISLDTETNGLLCWKDRLRVIALHIDGRCYLLLPEYYSKEELTAFFNRIKNNLIICHNTKFDVGFIYTHYDVLLTNLYCTYLGSQIVQGGLRGFKHGLKDCLKFYLNVELGDDKAELQKSFLNDRPLTAEQLAYAAKDTQYLVPLMEELRLRQRELGLEKIVKLENKLTPVLVKMEAHGCLIDVDKWRAKLREWETVKRGLVTQLDEELLRVYPWLLFANINYSSSKQIIGLFKSLKLPPPIKTDSKTKEDRESVDEGALDNYLNEHPNSPLAAFISKLKDFREYDKLLSTYGESFLERLDKNNHIHTSYGQCQTTTARLNSSNPNLQNIPSDKSGAGSAVREYFIAPPGYKFITSDMSGAEIALAADFSKDDLLMKSLKEGTDMHSELATISASIIYGQPIKISKSKDPIIIKGVTLIPQEFRDIHKSVTFSKFYKGGPKRIYEILARFINPVVPAKRRMAVAKEISIAIDKALPKLSKFLEDRIDEANSKGYLVATKLGRRRYFSHEVYGEAANSPIQGSNADAIKIAMINIDKYLTERNIGRMVLSVHDESCAIVKEEYAEEAAKVIKSEMAKALSYFLEDLKGEASVTISNNWEK